MNFNIKLRKFLLPDLSWIIKIEGASFPIGAYSKERFKNLWKLHPDDFVVAETQTPLEKNSLTGRGKIVGYIIAYLRRNFVDIDSMAVDKKYRGLGVGRILMTFMLGKFKKKGVKMASLEVRTTNKIAVSFYKNLGFKITKFIKKYYRDGADAYQMEKSLI